VKNNSNIKRGAMASTSSDIEKAEVFAGEVVRLLRCEEKNAPDDELEIIAASQQRLVVAIGAKIRAKKKRTLLPSE